VPEAGYLHQYSLVTVREGRIDVAAYPVGEALDPRAISGALVDQTTKLARQFAPRVQGALAFEHDFAVDGRVVIELSNPAERAIEVQLEPRSADSRWRVTPDHAHLAIEPGATAALELRCSRPPSAVDASVHLLEIGLQVEYLARGARIPLPRRVLAAPFELDSLPAPPEASGEHALALDGVDDHLSLDDARLALPDGPFTLELWVCGESFGERQGLACKTEQSEFGLFANAGKPGFTVHLGGRYVSVNAERALEPRRWTHVAGVFDGERVMLFVDGLQAAERAGKGARKRNALPLIIGGDVSGDGQANSLLHGALDEVRISSRARYATGQRFEPARRHTVDADTVLLLHMDGDCGPWSFDHSAQRGHPLRRGGAAATQLR